MKKYLILLTLNLATIFAFGQNVTNCDSAFIYKYFLIYDPESKTFEDIDEPFIEEYWLNYTEKAKKCFYKAAFLSSIPVDQRVIMSSYLDSINKHYAYNWIYNNLKSKQDTVHYFRIMSTSYGIPFSKLKIPEDVVNKYCDECKYE